MNIKLFYDENGKDLQEIIEENLITKSKII